MSDKEQFVIDTTIDALNYLITSDGEPALGGEQSFNRLHLTIIADSLTAIIGEGRGEAYADRDLGLLRAQAVFRDYWNYKDASVVTIANILRELQAFRTQAQTTVLGEDRMLTPELKPLDRVTDPDVAVLKLEDFDPLVTNPKRVVVVGPDFEPRVVNPISLDALAQRVKVELFEWDWLARSDAEYGGFANITRVDMDRYNPQPGTLFPVYAPTPALALYASLKRALASLGRH